jgi:hypothetical protein
LANTGNLLEVSLENGAIGEIENFVDTNVNRVGIDDFDMLTNVIECTVNNNVITPVQAEYKLKGERINDGTLYISLSGTVDRPVFSANAVINYDPLVPYSQIDTVRTFTEPVYYNGVKQDNMRFVGDVRVRGQVDGLQNEDKYLSVELISAKIERISARSNAWENMGDIILEFDEMNSQSSKQGEMHFVLGQDGEILERVDVYRVYNDPNASNDGALGYMKDYKLANGDVKVRMTGYVDGEDASSIHYDVSVDCAVHVKDSYFTPLHRIEITDFTNKLEKFKLYSSLKRRDGD